MNHSGCGSQLESDVVVIGGGLGGCMASLAAARMGLYVILTEETDWLGGQLTSQAVPPDEHQWIEELGCTATYREFRNRVRGYYKKNYPLQENAKQDDHLNPGNAWVSRLCHEPKVALRVLVDMLAPYINSGRISVLYHRRPVGAGMGGDRIQTIQVRHTVTGETETLVGQYFVDATECGDVLPMAGVEFVMGAEGRDQTGEPHALPNPDAQDIQPVTHVFALDYIEDGDFTIEKPAQYDFWRNFALPKAKLPLFSWFSGDPDDTTKLKQFTMFPDDSALLPMWTYRRAIDKSLFTNGLFKSDITLVNWPQNDYPLGSIYGGSEQERERHLAGAKQLSLSLLYWLQTETKRPDGGKGCPGLRLRKDVLGTEDGLAKFPYVRESRRVRALYTIKEQDVSRDIRGVQGIKRYEDSVGVGSYHLDIHPTTRSARTFYIPSYPYEIPLGALLPIRIGNLLPACKNIGTTQISNGCYRLHPTEWNIGESVGYLIGYAMHNHVTPRQVRENRNHLGAFQELIQEMGVELHWPSDVLG